MSTSCGLHPNWVFFKDCHVCSNQNNVGCPTKEGRKNVYLFILRHYYPSTNNNLFFFCFSDMAGGFAQRREAQRLARKAAIRNIESNPARNVERSTILAVVATSEDTGSTPPPATPMGKSPQRAKPAEKSKSKDFAAPTSRSKQSHEGEETEPQRKKSSQPLLLSSTPEFENVLALVEQTSGSRRIREGFQDLPLYPWIREGFRLLQERRELDTRMYKSRPLHSPTFIFSILRLENTLAEHHFEVYGLRHLCLC